MATTTPRAAERRPRRYSNLHYLRSVSRQVWGHPSNRRRRLRALTRAYGWQAYKRVSGRPLTLSYGPYRIRCHPDTGSAANVVYFTERFDPIEQSFLDAYLRPGDAVVDAGANVGLYSLWAAARTSPDGRVDAFEAEPHSVGRLRENIDLNELGERVIVHPAAVAAEPGSLSFSTDADVSNTVIPVGSPGGRPSVEVAAVALDDVLDADPYALGKIDVEGFEIEALLGWSQRLRTGDPPVLLIEATPGQLSRHQHTVDELADLLHDLGYQFRHYDPQKRELAPIESVEDRPDHNLFAVHRDGEGFVAQRLRTSDAAT